MSWHLILYMAVVTGHVVYYSPYTGSELPVSRLSIPIWHFCFNFKQDISQVDWCHEYMLTISYTVATERRANKNNAISLQTQLWRVTVLIDCFQVFIEGPSSLIGWAMTWPNYKRHNTAEFIGITPQGVNCWLLLLYPLYLRHGGGEGEG